MTTFTVTAEDFDRDPKAVYEAAKLGSVTVLDSKGRPSMVIARAGQEPMTIDRPHPNDCDLALDSGPDYACALVRGHDGKCLELYRGVPIGEQWSPSFRSWGQKAFAAWCTAQHKSDPT